MIQNAATKPIRDISPNGASAITNPPFSQQVSPTFGERLIRMAKQPTTLPRWALFISNGALIATVIVGAISFGRSAGRTETALQNSGKVPALQATVDTLSSQLVEIKGLIQEQNKTVNQTLDAQNKRIDSIQQAQNSGIASLGEKINSVQGQMGSVWALAQSDSNRMSKLEGMLTAMQLQQQHKEK